MMQPRLISMVCLGLLLLGSWPAAPAAGKNPLPREPADLLLVGNSVTAGIYYLSLNETSIRQGWAGQLMNRLGFEPSWGRFEKPYPINHLGLTRLGFTVGGLAYPWEAFRVVLPKAPRFEAHEERVTVAVPAQMLREVREQSSRNKGRNSSGWTFAALLLPKGLSVVELIEQWTKRPRWIVLFIGANDLLASFGIVGDAEPPSPEAFQEDYSRLVNRLRAVMHEDVGPENLLVSTLPDVIKLPMVQPLPVGADDGHGRRYPEGSKASAFLVPFRKHFDPEEVWTPAELARIHQTGTRYNDAIRTVAANAGFTVVDLAALMDRLSEDPAFATRNSPYFSPDLHHPSFRTHATIADDVLNTMAEVAGVEPPPPPAETETPLPHNGDFSARERARVDAMVHLALQGLRQGPLPPKPTYRVATEVGGQAAESRAGSAAISLMLGIESTPSPVTSRWLSRGGFHLRASPLVLDAEGTGDAEGFAKTTLEARAGIGIERIGAWHWTRVESGVLYAAEGGFGWYVRSEWRFLYAEVSSRDWSPDRIEAGLRWGWLFGRPGRNGN
jgi:lysophospholipase L1-like esterase